MQAIQDDSLFYTSSVIAPGMRHLFDNYEPAIEKAAREITNRGIREVIGVGGGASLSCMMGIEHLLTRFSTLPAKAVNGTELLSRTPRLDRSAVVLTSYSGQTPEVVAVAEEARRQGAYVIGITEHEGTPLAKLSDTPIGIQSKAVFISPLTVGYLLSAYLLKARGESAAEADVLLRDLHAFPEAVPALIEKASALAKGMVGPLAEHYYVIAGGPQQGLGYKLALSVIIENLWTNGAFINTGEFYHGPIEIVQKDGPSFLCLLGEDPSRAAAERVVRFLERQGAPLVTFDSRTYGSYSPEMAPFPLFIATELWVMWTAATLGHDVDERRYMGRLSRTWGEF